MLLDSIQFGGDVGWRYPHYVRDFGVPAAFQAQDNQCLVQRPELVNDPVELFKPFVHRRVAPFQNIALLLVVLLSPLPSGFFSEVRNRYVQGDAVRPG